MSNHECLWRYITILMRAHTCNWVLMSTQERSWDLGNGYHKEGILTTYQLLSLWRKWTWTSCFSQGWPIFGTLPQIWVNWKFQIWGNDPNLGQKLNFKFEIQWESNSSLSHNYSRTWPKHSRIFICVELTTTIRSHRNITKKHVLDNTNFSKYGKLT